MTINSVDTNRRLLLLGSAFTVAGLGFSRLAIAQETDNLYTQIVNSRIKKGKEALAAEVIQSFIDIHREKSPDLLIYLYHQSTRDPLSITSFEVFKSRESASAIGRASYITPLYDKFGEAFEEDPERVVLTRLMGFTR